ncbi:MAG TPA: hypothetical protein VLH39_06360 [Magnetospirillaceae bacterium]|nr:hypothetical protein [Magnetospirillaceae bacterium]
MYENLIGQEEAAGALRNDLERGWLPPSILLSGPENSGKLTAALETARALSCAMGPAAWNCPCPGCVRHRTLSHPDLLLMGPRSVHSEIKAAGELLGRNPNNAARYLFLRAVRKLSRRFDPALYEGEESRLSKVAPLLQSLEELAEAAGPGTDESRGQATEATEAAAKALSLADRLESLLPDSIPIFQVRATERWARLAPYGRTKVAVLENAERMQDGARNSLLKILEEPPDTASFILLSSRPSSILPTILSRVRPYALRARDAESSREVLAKVFRVLPAEAGLSLDDFLAARKPLSPAQMDEFALRYLAAVCYQASRDGIFIPEALLDLSSDARDQSVSEVLQRLTEATKNFGQADGMYSYAFSAFMRSLYRRIGVQARSADAKSADVLAGWCGSIREAQLRYDSYNLPPAALAERLAEDFAGSLQRSR